MKLSIYLHRQIVDVLQCFGTLEEAVNHILQDAANGEFDVMHKPACPSRDGAGRYDIDITEPTYLELLDAYGPFSSKISIRRLIYWFIENEMYDELGWEQSKDFRDRNKLLLLKKLQNAISELEKAKRYCANSVTTHLTDICKTIQSLREELQNEK